MNEETAGHYNTLWDRVNREELKVVYRDTTNIVKSDDDVSLMYCGIVIEGGFPSETNKLSCLIRGLVAKFSGEAIKEELQLAAREGRRADAYIDSDNPLTWGLYNGHHKGAGGLLVKKILPELLETVKQLNSIAKLNFNCYRMLCEQGVATPPPSKENGTF